MRFDKFYILFFISVLMILLVSCTDNGGNEKPKATMYALVENQNWQTPEPNAVITESRIDIFGTSNGRTIQISIKSGQKGEYQLGLAQGHEGKFFPNLSPGTLPFSTNTNEQGMGIVNITSLSHETRTISGNFYFTGYRPSDNAKRVISDGRFSNVPFSFIHDTDTSSFANILTCQVDGANWIATEIQASQYDSLRIYARNENTNERIKLVFPVNIEAGVHYITSTGPVYAYFEPIFHSFMATNGSATINEHDTENNIIKGSFFFNFINNEEETISVTSGFFQIEYEN